ncbi:MAG: hypothetical protein Q8P01_02180 [bacterium]|nr:hypothetical protein [bacterium]
MKTKIKYPIIAGIGLLVLQTIFSALNLYQTLPFFDIPMHFTGGLIVAWFLTALFAKDLRTMRWRVSALVIIGGTAIVGIHWEFFEWFLDNFVFIKTQFMGGLNDTLFDLFMDLLGACVIAVMVRRKVR